MQRERDCRVVTVCREGEIARLREYAGAERLQDGESLQRERDCRVERVCRGREIAGLKKSAGGERCQG